MGLKPGAIGITLGEHIGNLKGRCWGKTKKNKKKPLPLPTPPPPNKYCKIFYNLYPCESWKVFSIKEHIFHVGEVFLNIKKKKALPHFMTMPSMHAPLFEHHKHMWPRNGLCL
jgi:hypothetical protein